MTHKEYKELLVLSVYGELPAENENDLNQHLSGCSSCREELAELNLLHEMLDQDQLDSVDDILSQSRRQLFGTLKAKANRPSFMQRVRRAFLIVSYSVERRFSPETLAAAAVMLVVGFGLGYLVFALTSPAEGISLDPFSASGITVTSVSFQETDAAEGEVELSFQASKVFQVRGPVEDQKIQRLLAYALINEQNPGVRLRAVGTIERSRLLPAKAEIRTALISALKTDPNPAIRQQALTVLRKEPFDPEFRQALLHVLLFDDNMKLKIEAITAFESYILAGQQIDDNVVSVLRQQVEQDSNNYIRIRAKSVLEQAGYDSLNGGL
jgi:hypothetical protein